MFIVQPTSNNFVNSFDSYSSGGVAFHGDDGAQWSRIDDIVQPLVTVGSRNDVTNDDYIQGNLGASPCAAFNFGWPANYTTRNYGDGTNLVDLPQIVSITLHVAIATIGAQINPVPIMYRDSTATDLGSAWAVTTVAPSYEHVSVTFTTDAVTGAAWTLANLVSTGFGFDLPAGPPEGSLTRCTRIYMEITEAEWQGGHRARRGPAEGEPSIFCIMCSTPFHISKLIKIEDPLHPNYGQYVCEQDLDESIEVEDDALRGTSLKEGDIDFDLE